MTDSEVAWLAGLFEGEGCITFTSTNSVVISVAMTDKDIIDRLPLLTGVGSIYTTDRSRSTSTGTKTLYCWKVGNKAGVTKILEMIQPWMGNRRREKVEQALVRLTKNKGIGLPIIHGTCKGYKLEEYRNLSHCQPCKTARAEYERIKRVNRRTRGIKVGKRYISPDSSPGSWIPSPILR